MLWERTNELQTSFFYFTHGMHVKFLSVYYNYVQKQDYEGDFTVC